MLDKWNKFYWNKLIIQFRWICPNIGCKSCFPRVDDIWCFDTFIKRLYWLTIYVEWIFYLLLFFDAKFWVTEWFSLLKIKVKLMMMKGFYFWMFETITHRRWILLRWFLLKEIPNRFNCYSRIFIWIDWEKWQIRCFCCWWSGSNCHFNFVVFNRLRWNMLSKKEWSQL